MEDLIELQNDEKFVSLKKEIESIHNQQQTILKDFIQSGYKDLIAKILVYLDEDKKSEVIKTLPEEIQSYVIQTMENYKKTDGNVMLEVARILSSCNFDENAFDSFVKLHKEIPLKDAEALAVSYEQKNPVLASSLCEIIDSFIFDDLAYLDDRAIQKILRDIESQQLALALKDAEEKVQDKIFRNMSNRASSMLKEDMEFMGPVRLQDIQKARQIIIDIVHKLEDNGDIQYSRNINFSDLEQLAK